MRKKKKYLIWGIIVIALSGVAIICSKYPNLFSINSHQVKQASPKEQQLEEVKKHAKEIEDFVKSLSPKVESVQIAWDETQWEEVGNGTPQSGGQVLRVFGGFNHIQKLEGLDRRSEGYHFLLLPIVFHPKQSGQIQL